MNVDIFLLLFFFFVFSLNVFLLWKVFTTFLSSVNGYFSSNIVKQQNVFKMENSWKAKKCNLTKLDGNSWRCWSWWRHSVDEEVYLWRLIRSTRLTCLMIQCEWFIVVPGSRKKFLWESRRTRDAIVQKQNCYFAVSSTTTLAVSYCVFRQQPLSNIFDISSSQFFFLSSLVHVFSFFFLFLLG